MLFVKDGKILSTYVLAAATLPAAHLLVGDRLDCVDRCLTHDEPSTVAWSLSDSEGGEMPRGGARPERPPQPRAAMLVWAEDKVQREVPGLNVLTVRMLLKAEQRTVSAVLHSRSPSQTREVLIAAYRRAGLVMQNTDNPQPHTEAIVTNEMTRALTQQTAITAEVADRLAASPINQDFIQLLEATRAHASANDMIISQTTRIME